MEYLSSTTWYRFLFVAVSSIIIVPMLIICDVVCCSHECKSTLLKPMVDVYGRFLPYASRRGSSGLAMVRNWYPVTHTLKKR